MSNVLKENIDEKWSQLLLGLGERCERWLDGVCDQVCLVGTGNPHAPMQGAEREWNNTRVARGLVGFEETKSRSVSTWLKVCALVSMKS